MYLVISRLELRGFLSKLIHFFSKNGADWITNYMGCFFSCNITILKKEKKTELAEMQKRAGAVLKPCNQVLLHRIKSYFEVKDEIKI